MIVQFPDKILRQISEPVAEREDITPVLASMRENLDRTDGLGIAAVQVGVLKNIIIVGDPQKNTKTVMINPQILSVGDGKQVKSEEGCLSFSEGKPKATIKRYETVDVAYLDLNFEKQAQHFEGLPAIVVQHEVDHTLGIMFIDHLSRLKRTMLLKKVKL